jgi:hypothetical protein
VLGVEDNIGVEVELVQQAMDLGQTLITAIELLEPVIEPAA